MRLALGPQLQSMTVTTTDRLRPAVVVVTVT